MLRFIIKRLLLLPLLMLLFTVVVFALVQAPPGDFLTSYVAMLASSGSSMDAAQVAALRHQFGLDQPVYVRYLLWLGSLLRGDLGLSLEYQRPSAELIGERMLALILMWVCFSNFGLMITGLFSPQYTQAPWSLGRFIDLLKHIWLPAIVLGVAGTARLMRIMRANLLDELNKPYVVMARAKGMSEWTLVVKYPVRMAFSPIISTIGWYLPQLFSGSLIVATVMNLPNIGPLLLRSLIQQDMYLAGSIMLIYCALTIIGTLISDILLALFDPRRRSSPPRTKSASP